MLSANAVAAASLALNAVAAVALNEPPSGLPSSIVVSRCLAYLPKIPPQHIK